MDDWKIKYIKLLFPLILSTVSLGCAPRYVPVSPLAIRLSEAGITGIEIDYANRCAAGEIGLCERTVKTIADTHHFPYGEDLRIDARRRILEDLCRNQSLGPEAGACMSLLEKQLPGEWYDDAKSGIDPATLGCNAGEGRGRLCYEAGKWLPPLESLPLLNKGCKQGSVLSCCDLFVAYMNLQNNAAQGFAAPVSEDDVSYASEMCEQDFNRHNWP